jgi:UDP-N-acetylmuramoyl-tripeptide--D-alanyl-D-alanine ligase
MMERLSQLATRIGRTLAGPDAAVLRVVTDTRAVQPGDLFVALRGERFDAHDFVAEAVARGAVGVLVQRPMAVAVGQIVVQDTLAALQALAASWRRSFTLPVVAVTGSNGKTTTKQLLAAVFAARGPVLATEGNLNNHIGVPLTLLKLRAIHATAVIEMGANHAGEIALLARLAAPDVGIVTQAGDAHLEGFGSREGVAHAKGELFVALRGENGDATPSAGGVAIINADDPYAPLWQQLAGSARRITFGLNSATDVRAEQIELHADGVQFDLLTPVGHASVALPLPGAHNVMNALAAAAAGVALGLDAVAIARGLAGVEKPKGRVNVHVLPGGARLIDDSYNANPSSLAAGVALLAAEAGQRLLVLGDMAELGPASDALHAAAGREAKSAGIDALYALGTRAEQAARAFGEAGQCFETLDALVAALRPRLTGRTTVLVKGSRSARMERVVAAVLDSFPHTAGPVSTEATH